MTHHPTQSDLLGLVSGTLPREQADGLRAHISCCPTCERSYQELQASWDALAAWRVDHSELDVVETVMRRASEPAEYVRLVRSGPWQSPLRLAASIVLAGGLGVAAGTLTSTMRSSPPSPSPERIAESLGLTYFAADSATGLPGSLEPDARRMRPEGGSP